LQVGIVQGRANRGESSVLSFNSIRYAQQEVSQILENIEAQKAKVEERSEVDAPYKVDKERPWYWNPSSYNIDDI
jgi:hypothetical protein